MKLLFYLGFRNLYRQKRRNILLGIAIAFGTMILIMANSYSRGLSDILLNKMIVYMTGHIDLAIMEKSRQWNLVIRDKDKFIRLIRQTVSGVDEILETVTDLTRVIGNGHSENMMLVGLETEKNKMKPEDIEYFNTRLDQGSLENFNLTDLENPVLLYADKARTLNHLQLNQVSALRIVGEISQIGRVLPAAPFFLKKRAGPA